MCFQVLDFETSRETSIISNTLSGKLLLSKLRYFRGSRFSQCISNISPSLITKYVFMLTIILSNCGVFQQMHKITNRWNDLSSIDCRSCEITMKEKTTLSHEVVCFLKLDFETSNSKSEVSEIKFMENYFLLENYVTSEGAFLTMFCTINLSPLLITKRGFMTIMILSHYQ